MNFLYAKLYLKNNFVVILIIHLILLVVSILNNDALTGYYPYSVFLHSVVLCIVTSSQQENYFTYLTLIRINNEKRTFSIQQKHMCFVMLLYFLADLVTLFALKIFIDAAMNIVPLLLAILATYLLVIELNSFLYAVGLRHAVSLLIILFILSFDLITSMGLIRFPISFLLDAIGGYYSFWETSQIGYFLYGLLVSLGKALCVIILFYYISIYRKEKDITK